MGKVSAKIPGWDYNQIPYINAWGEEEEYASLPANIAYNLLSPSYIDKGVEDWVSVELTRLNELQSDVNTLPRTPEKTISYEDKDGVVHEDYNLSAEEYVALAKEQGQTQRKILEKMLSSELYGSLPDQYKAKAVALAYDYAREKAQIEVLGRNSFSSQWMSEIKDDIAGGIVSHVIEENIKGMYLDGDISADEAVARRVKYCGDTQEEAEEKLRKWEAEVKNGFAYDELKQNFLDGTISAADVVTTLMTVEKKTRDEAKNRIVEYARDAYDGGIFDRNEALSAMVSGGLTRSEADSKLRYIDVKKQFPDAYIDNDWVDEYYEEVETSGVSIALFIDYRNQVKGITGEGKKARRMAVIDSLSITNAQKDALYYAEGWAASTIDEAPWRR